MDEHDLAAVKRAAEWIDRASRSLALADQVLVDAGLHELGNDVRRKARVGLAESYLEVLSLR